MTCEEYKELDFVEVAFNMREEVEDEEGTDTVSGPKGHFINNPRLDNIGAIS